jgi:iron-sulfur cluster assembly accessory protein
MNSRQIITASKIAIDKLQSVLQDSNKNAILFYVKGGGCNGFSYNLKPTNDAPGKMDEVVHINDIEIHICNRSMIHVLGTHIDWKQDIMGQGFHFENPMAQSKCGCGTSFSSRAIN